MKFVCKKSDLLKGVNIVLKAVPSKTTMSILECILIDASAGQIKMTANDMELGIETVIEGDIPVSYTHLLSVPFSYYNFDYNVLCSGYRNCPALRLPLR